MLISRTDDSRAEHGSASHVITKDMILQFAGLLRDHEKSSATIDKYTRDVCAFLTWLGRSDPEAGAPRTADTPADRDKVPEKETTETPGAPRNGGMDDTICNAVHETETAETPGAPRSGGMDTICNAVHQTESAETPGVPRRVTKETVRQYKQHLKEHYRLTSANSMLSALNTFFKYMGWQECSVMIFKTQRVSFRSTEKDLSREEYRNLLRAAENRTGRAGTGGHQLAMIMETLAGTGIRVSELPFITVASLATRRALVSLKGKTRTVLLNSALCGKLRAYCRERGITEGSIFVTRTGKPVDRSAILRRMKALAASAGVLREKIYPHNLRHFFAVTYYEKERDIVHLADILGHASINTTRIYTLVTCETQLGILDRIGDLLHPKEPSEIRSGMPA